MIPITMTTDPIKIQNISAEPFVPIYLKNLEGGVVPPF
jgi:hypothetical protein